MTTLPLDDPADGAAPPTDGHPGSGLPSTAVAPDADDTDDTSGGGEWIEPGRTRGRARRPAASADPVTGWAAMFHPVRWWEGRGHRYLPGASFPVAVFVVWRACHLMAIWLLQSAGGASTIQSSLFYDGERYELIMRYGYATFGNPSGTTEMPNSAFFPLVSWLAAPIYALTRNVAWSSQVVANVTAVAAFVTVWGLTKVWRDERIARRAVLLMALLPASLYLWQFYSEALFISLAAGGLWADRRGRRGVAALCFFGLATTRSIGFLVPAVLVAVRVVAPLAGGLVRRGRRPRRKVDWASLGYLAAAFAGLAIVMVVLWQQVNDPLAFMHVQKDWGRGLSAPWTSIRSGYQLLYPSGNEIMIPALVSRNFDLWCLPIVFFAIGYAAISAAPAWLVVPGQRAGSAIGGWWRRHGGAATVALIAGGVAAAAAALILLRRYIPVEVYLFAVAPLVLIALPLAIAAPTARKDRFPPEAWLIGASLIALPLCSSVLPSFNRFVMADFIIYPVYASLLQRIPGKARVALYLALAALCLWTVVAMLGRISVNRFVG